MTQIEYLFIRKTTHGASFKDGSNLRKLYDWIDELREANSNALAWLRMSQSGTLGESPTIEEVIKALEEVVGHE